MKHLLKTPLLIIGNAAAIASPLTTDPVTSTPLFDDGGTRSIYGEPEGKINLFKLRVDCGGYDKDGNYWGLGSATTGYVYVASAGPKYKRHTWAKSRAEAAKKLGIESKDLSRPL